MAVPTPISRREIVSWALIIVALISIGIGYFKLDDNQGRIAQEAKNRAYSECLNAQYSRNGERKMIEFVTQPVPTEGFSGDLLKAKIDSNEKRAQARLSLLNILPEITCMPNGADVAKVQAEFKASHPH